MAALFFLFPCAAGAQITVCVHDAPPYVILDEVSHNIRGVTISLLKYALDMRHANVSASYGKVEMLPQPFVRCLEGLRNGEYDAIPFVIKRSKARPYLRYTRKLFSAPAHFFRLAEPDSTPFEFEDYADLQGLSLGVIKAISYGSEVDEQIASARFHIYTAPSREALIELMLAGRLDLIVGNRDFVRYQLLKAGKPGALQASVKVTDLSDYYIGLSHLSPLVKDIDRINARLVAAQKQGEIARLQRQFYAESPETRE